MVYFTLWPAFFKIQGCQNWKRTEWPQVDFEILTVKSASYTLIYTLREDKILENAFQGWSYIGNQYINRGLEFGEVNMAIYCPKNRKAVGMDRIPNEVLKNDNVETVLYKYFSVTLTQGGLRLFGYET